VGQGSTFTIKLPAVKAAGDAPRASAPDVDALIG
jgi:hypothetical protein